MANTELRPYQKVGIKQIFDAWNPNTQNLKNVLFQMPTGTGKTTVFSEIVRKANDKQKKVLIVVHRIELVEQICGRLTQFGVKPGVISAKTKAEPDCDIQVATIQTLSNRIAPQADIVVIDECHHSKAQTYKKLWEIYPEARFLGVTATPVRITGEGFDDLFDVLISLGKLSDFIKEGYLAPTKHLVCGIPDLTSVKQSRSDYDIKMLSNVMLDNKTMASLVNSYDKYIPGKKVIVFAVDKEHSREIARRYNDAGVPAIHLDSDTPSEERNDILERFKVGDFLVLSNVNIVSEGFDVPDCDAVQLARPTKSLALYLQQVGRCMRPSPGKEYGYVLDNAGLWLEHGLSFIDRNWTLKGRRRPKTKSSFPEVASIDAEGIIRQIHKPMEADGLELVELSEEILRLLTFESFLGDVLSRGYKPISSFFRYKDYLVENANELTEIETKYISKRLSKHNVKYKSGFWFHSREEVHARILERRKGTVAL